MTNLDVKGEDALPVFPYPPSGFSVSSGVSSMTSPSYTSLFSLIRRPIALLKFSMRISTFFTSDEYTSEPTMGTKGTFGPSSLAIPCTACKHTKNQTQLCCSSGSQGINTAALRLPSFLHNTEPTRMPRMKAWCSSTEHAALENLWRKPWTKDKTAPHTNKTRVNMGLESSLTRAMAVFPVPGAPAKRIARPAIFFILIMSTAMPAAW